MIRKKILLAGVILILAVVLYEAGSEMTLEGLRKAFENRKMKTLPCYYFGRYCNLETQYCNEKTECEEFLSPNDSKEENIRKCRDLLKKEEQKELYGMYDVCIYYLGSLDKKVILDGGLTIEELRASFENRTTMQIPCVYDGQLCKLESQFCNKTSRRCEDLFEETDSESEKREKCEGILQQENAKPGPYDTCIYYLGKLTNKYGFGESSSDNKAAIVLGVIAAILLIVSGALYALYLYRKKMPPQKSNDPSENVPMNTTGGDDENAGRQSNLH